MRFLGVIFSFFCISISHYSHAYVQGDLSFISDLKPGNEIQVKMVLNNENDTPEPMLLKKSDYRCNADGENFFEEPGTLSRSNAKWIDLPVERVVIPPKGKTDIFFTIRAPNDQQLNGSYYSVILIEHENLIGSTTPPETPSINLNIKLRYGYKVITNFDQGIAKLKLIKRDLVQEDKQSRLKIDVENIGTLFLTPKMQLKIFDQKGKALKTLQMNSQNLFPGSSVRYTTEPLDVPPGKYVGYVLLDNSDQNLFGDQFNFTIP